MNNCENMNYEGQAESGAGMRGRDGRVHEAQTQARVYGGTFARHAHTHTHDAQRHISHRFSVMNSKEARRGKERNEHQDVIECNRRGSSGRGGGGRRISNFSIRSGAGPSESDATEETLQRKRALSSRTIESNRFQSYSICLS